MTARDRAIFRATVEACAAMTDRRAEVYEAEAEKLWNSDDKDERRFSHREAAIARSLRAAAKTLRESPYVALDVYEIERAADRAEREMGAET